MISRKAAIAAALLSLTWFPAVAAEPKPATTCRLYKPVRGADPLEAERLLASFRSDYPQALRSRHRAERADLQPAELQDLVTGLACLSTWPGAQPLVPETAAPLFASKRYGQQAFVLLDKIGNGPGASESLRAAVQSFAAQMRFEIARF